MEKTTEENTELTSKIQRGPDSKDRRQVRRTTIQTKESDECEMGCEAGDIYRRERGRKTSYRTDISIALILIALIWWAIETKKVEIVEPTKQVIGPRVR